MITNREIKILKQIIESKSGISRNELSELLSVSTRTIRNDIHAINDYLHHYNINVDMDEKQSYYISQYDEEIARKVLDDCIKEYSIIPENNNDRNLYIFLELFGLHDAIEIKDISNELFISRSTVQLCIKETVEDFFSSNRLNYKINANTISIEGKESDKRNTVYKLLFKYYNSEKFMYITKVLKNFGYYDDSQYIDLFNYIVQYFESNDIILSDKSIQILTIMLLIVFDRINNGFSIEVNYEVDNSTSMDFIKMEEYFSISLNEREKRYIGYLVDMSLIYSNKNKMGNTRIAKVICEEFIVTICNEYDININIFKKYSYDLEKHINTMIHRITQNIFEDSNSSMCEYVKENYPFAFEIATNMILIIKKHLNVDITKNEICYIASHIAVIFNNNRKKINVAIICGTGGVTAKLAEVRINNALQNRVNIVGTYPEYLLKRIINENSLELIISMIPINYKINLPIIEISDFVTDSDISRIDKYTNKSFYDFFEDSKNYELFSEKTFMVFNGEVNETDALIEIAKAVCLNQEIENADEYISSIFVREKLHSTKFGKVWIPHPMSNFGKRSNVGIGILKDKHEIIFLTSVVKNDAAILKNFYDCVAEIIDNDSKIKNLCNCKDMIEFVKKLYKL